MHSPKTVAHEIYFGRSKKKDGNYRLPIITIWHVDPEKDGTDDSCGWFMRSRHGNLEMMKKIRDSISRNFDSSFISENTSENTHTYYTGYFDKTGNPLMSVHAIVLGMFTSAAWEYFQYNRKKHTKYMRENLYDILQFAENPNDSLHQNITGFFRIPCGEPWKREEALNEYVNIIYGWLLRTTRKWYQHPRWHIHHWEIQFHPLKQLIRRYWTKCSVCGKRGFKGSAHSDWDGTKIWHSECDSTIQKPTHTWMFGVVDLSSDKPIEWNKNESNK